MKRRIIISFLIILPIIITSGCLNPSYEEFNGLGSTFDVHSSSSLIAFSDYIDDRGSLYIYNYSSNNNLHKFDDYLYSYYSPHFSQDGSKIVFIRANISNRENKCIMLVDINSGNTSIITEKYFQYSDCVISFDMKSVYYLEYGYFGSYSPIAQDHRHEFDIFQINISTKEVTQITFLNLYEMGELSISPDGNKLMYRTFEGIFNVKYNFYLLDLSTKESKLLRPDGDFYEEIFTDPIFSLDEDMILFQAVSDNDKHYIYNIYEMNIHTKEAEQVTFEKGYLGEPKPLDDGSIICIEDYNWPNQPSKNRFYSTGETEISIDFEKLRMI